jgi:hypothetical protein
MCGPTAEPLRKSSCAFLLSVAEPVWWLREQLLLAPLILWLPCHRALRGACRFVRAQCVTCTPLCVVQGPLEGLAGHADPRSAREGPNLDDLRLRHLRCVFSSRLVVAARAVRGGACLNFDSCILWLCCFAADGGARSSARCARARMLKILSLSLACFGRACAAGSYP